MLLLLQQPQEFFDHPTHDCSGSGGGSGSGGESAAFASGGRDSVINLWAASGSCVGSVGGHGGTVQQLSDINLLGNTSAFNNGAGGGGKAVPAMFSISTGGTLKLWALQGFKQLGEFNITGNGGNGNGSGSNSNGNGGAEGAQKSTSNKGVWSGQNIVTANGPNGVVRRWSPNQPERFGERGGRGVEWSSKEEGSHGCAVTDLLSTGKFRLLYTVYLVSYGVVH